MASAKHDDPIYAIATTLGKLEGSVNAVQNEIRRLNDELVRMSIAEQAKHKENVEQIRTYHEESVKAITDHQAEDNENFKDVRKILHMLWYSGLGALAAVSAIWAVFQFLVPYLMRQ